MNCQPLYEAYRPKTWSEIIGQPKAIAKLDFLRSRRGTLAQDCYLISGASGTGKTSLALLLAEETADPWNVTEFSDPSELTADVFRSLTEQRYMRPFGKGCCIVLNECHGLRSDQVRKLLGLTERLPAWMTFVRTTTTTGEASLFENVDDATALLSRCKRIPLARRDLSKAFAQRAREIAQAEGLDGKPLDCYIRLVHKHKLNLRAVLQDIEGGCMIGVQP